MKLRRLEIGLLPGIDKSFELKDLGDGMNVIIGPNGIGKSSLSRALVSLLWREGAGKAQIVASARFDSDRGAYSVTREASLWRWELDGIQSDAPSLPPFHQSQCFFLGLRDLLDPTGHAGSDVARAIREEMSGGYNLADIAKPFDVGGPLRRAQGTRRKCGEAQKIVHSAEREQALLQEREAGLEELSAKLERASRAGERCQSFETGIQLLDERVTLAECEAQLDDLPQSLAKISGGESSELSRLDTQLQDKHKARLLATGELDVAMDAAKASGLVEPISATTLGTARRKAKELADLEAQLRSAERELQAMTSAVHDAGRPLGAAADHELELSLDDGESLFAFLRAADSVATGLEGVDEQLEVLETEASPEGGYSLQQLRRGIDQLRNWLRSPELVALPVSVASAPAPTSKALLGLAIALSLLGLALGLLVDSVLFGLVALGVGLLLGARWKATDQRDEDTASTPQVEDVRARVQRDYEPGLAPLGDWSESEVASTLRQLEDDAAGVAIDERDALACQKRRGELQARRKRLVEESAQTDARGRQIAEQLGLEEVPGVAHLVDCARAMDQLREARTKRSFAAGAVAELRDQLNGLLGELAEQLRELGQGKAGDSATAMAILEDLVRRDQAFENAGQETRRLLTRIQGLDAEVEKLEAGSHTIYVGAGIEVGQRAELDRAVSQVEQFKSLESDRKSQAKTIARMEQQLQNAGEGALIEMTLEQLSKEHEQSKSAAGEVEKLHGEKAAIEGEVRRIREGHAIEEGLSAKEKSLDQLEATRREAMLACAGTFLVESITKEHDKDSMPRVLGDARQLFSDFTHDEYDLRIAPQNDKSFVAFERRTEKMRELGELSDGTRIQLALAARLAFVKQAERGHPLPLFLDEALDHSDAGRFHAIARSLGKMAAVDGRQVFYLTSDPADITRLQSAFDEENAGEIRVIDLAHERGRDSAIQSAAELQVAPRPPVPSPHDLTPEQYGAKLGVPQFNPRRGAPAQHLFYVLGDDLATLKDLLERPIEFVGQWQGFSENGNPNVKDFEARGGAPAELAQRANLLRVFCDLWLEGRGKSVGRAALESSGAISDAKLEATTQIAQDLNGDAQALIAALLDRTTHPLAKRFHKKMANALQSYLLDEGYIDPRPPLDEPGLTAKALACHAAAVLPASTTNQLLHRWWSYAESSLVGSPSEV
jgi:exonuclease SbcC